MNGRAATILVARREIRERSRSRSFRISTLLTAVILAGIVVFPTVRDERASYEIGIVAPASAPLRSAVQRTGRVVDADVAVRNIDSASAARDQLRAGSLDIALVGGERLLVRRPVEADETSARARLVRSISEAVRLQRGLERAGIPPEQAARSLASPPPPVDAVLPARADSTSRATAIYGVILLYILLVQYGAWIVNGVVEEKASRVIEVLLSAVRPRELLFGKVVGIGLVALGQAVLLLAVVLATAAAVGSNVLRGTSIVAALTMLLWLLLGYWLYCWLYAAAGSLVSRTEDAQNVSFPVSIPLLVSYLISFTAMTGGEVSPLVRVLSFFPFSAPFLMPVRVAVGDASPMEVLIAAVATVAGILLVARAAASVYERAVLRTGARIGWRDAVRLAS